VIVSTLNATLASIAGAAISAGKHVLIEKPAGISAREIEELVDMAAKRMVAVRVGYNHRYHPSFQKAREIVDSGALGSVMYVRGRYGHGGRVGYDREWRADPKQSGGGELIDQGVHLIDLAGWFLISWMCWGWYAAKILPTRKRLPRRQAEGAETRVKRGLRRELSV
jgi:predicted dehydrogenase